MFGLHTLLPDVEDSMEKEPAIEPTLIGQYFRKCRAELGKPLLFVSWKTGLSESTISKAERGIMTERTREALKNYYG